jgi:hypothetical protein
MACVGVCSLVAGSGSSNGWIDLFNVISSFFGTLVVVVVSLLIVALVALVVALAWRIWQQGRVSRLVIDPVVNATSNIDLDKLLPGLNQLMRETLATTLHRMLDLVNHDNEPQTDRERSGLQGSTQPQTSQPFTNLLSHTIDRYPLPEAAHPDRLTALLASLQAGSSERLPAQLLRSATGARGRRIITTLQSGVDGGDSRSTTIPPAVVPGLSFEILDVQGKQPSQFYTFWSPLPTSPASTPTTMPSVTSTLSALPKAATGTLEQPASTSASGSTGRRKKTTEITAVQQPAPATNTAQDAQYLTLLQCAAQWLAIEIARETLLADENRRWRMPSLLRGRFKQSTAPASQADRSRLANFTGYFHRSVALAYPQFPVFYELAIRDFEQAIALHEQCYQPRENLADTYVMQALATIVLPGREEQRIIGERPDSRAKVYLYKAMTCYDEALQLLDQQEHLQAAPVQAEQTEQEKEAWRNIERRAQLGKSIALLLLGDEENVKRSMRGLKYLRSMQWNLEEERDYRLLYNLACWYALADLCQLDVPEMLALPDENAQQAACRYLIYSMMRDSHLWQSASRAPGDPCFSNLFPIASASRYRDRLQLALAQKDYEVRATSRGQRDLSTLKGKEFEEAALTIRQRVWESEQM